VADEVAFATTPSLRNIHSPPYDSFYLSKGYDPDKAKLKSILGACKVPFHEILEYQVCMSRLCDLSAGPKRPRERTQLSSLLQHSATTLGQALNIHGSIYLSSGRVRLTI
jgi:hypothetical protein